MSNIGPYPGGGVPNPDAVAPQPREHPLANYQFSSDELRVLRECNTESFFQRSLPLGTSFGLAAYFGVKSGKLAANSKFGAVPKIVVGVIFGYFLGKVSYQKKCAEKIMLLPNSRLAEILRQKHNAGGAFSPEQFAPGAFGLPFSSSSAGVIKSDDIYDDFHLRGNKSSSLDLDTERPSNSGLDDQQRPNVDLNSDLGELELEQRKDQVSYDDLRKSNRERYYKSLESSGSTSPLPQDAPPVIRSTNQQQASSSSNTRDEASRSKLKGKNQYGDEWS